MKEQSVYKCQSRAADLSQDLQSIQLNDNFTAQNIHIYHQRSILITNLKQICKLLVEGSQHQAIKIFDDFFNKNDISSSTGHIIYYLKGRIYEGMQKYDKAADAYNQCIKYKEDFEPAYRENAALQEKCDNHVQALRIYNKWSKINTNRGEIFEKMGEICSKFSSQNLNEENKFKELTKLYLMQSILVGQKNSLNVKKFDLNFYQQMISTIQ